MTDNMKVRLMGMRAAIPAVLAGALLLANFAVREARGSNFFVLKEGTPVVVALGADFDAAHWDEGRKVPMVVDGKVTVDGFVLIDKGEIVEATFIRGNTAAEGSGLLRISTVRATDGQDVALRPTPEVSEEVEANDNASRLSIAVTQENRRMPEGTTFKVYVSESYFIEE